MDTVNHDRNEGPAMQIPVMVDCQPPPYSTTRSTRSSYRCYPTPSSYGRSESTENIITLDTLDGSDFQHKFCCSSMRCLLCLTTFLQFKRMLILLVISIVACTITSITLGLAKIPESSYVTLSIMFAGE